MTSQTESDHRLTEILAAIARQAEKARKRAVQIEGYFQNRAASSGMLEALASVRASVLRELAEDEVYRELQGQVAKAAELAEGGRLEPREQFAVVRRFFEKLTSAAHRPIDAESSSFMANAATVERHNAVLRVLEDLGELIDEGRPLPR